jgi:hypothetical protein
MAIWGGANLVEIYPIATGAAGTLALTLGGPYPAPPVISVAVAIDANDIATITVTHEKDDADYYAWRALALPGGATAQTRPQRFADDGTSYGGSAAGAVTWVVVVYGGTEDGGTDRKMLSGTFNLDSTSGGWTQTNNTANQPVTVFKSVKTGGDVTVGAAKYNTVKVTAPGSDVTIPQEHGYLIHFETAAS